jgi:hypothetical protein
MTDKQFAKVSWTVNDILDLRPEWTREQAHQWLVCNNRHLQDRMIESGWEIIKSLLEYDAK